MQRKERVNYRVKKIFLFNRHYVKKSLKKKFGLIYCSISINSNCEAKLLTQAIKSTWALKLNYIVIKSAIDQNFQSKFFVWMEIVATKLIITNQDLIKNIENELKRSKIGQF